jgi:hypothetical protein
MIKKTILVSLAYGILVSIILISTYILFLTLDQKLQLFCPLDEATPSENPPVECGWMRAKCPNDRSDLRIITVWEAMDAGEYVYYCNVEQIFWISIFSKDLVFYGPYSGTTWTLIINMDLLALVLVIMSCFMVCIFSLYLWSERNERTI